MLSFFVGISKMSNNDIKKCSFGLILCQKEHLIIFNFNWQIYSYNISSEIFIAGFCINKCKIHKINIYLKEVLEKVNISELIVRITLGYVILFILTRIMGRKEISQMTFFNFVSAIAIGSIAANLVVSQNLSIRNGIIALIGWSVFTLIMDFIDIKSKKARIVTTGNPIIVIKEGKIIEQGLRKSRLDLDSLKAMLRQKNIFSVADVDYAIFETNGRLSVIKKEPIQSVTKSDMNITSMQKNIFSIPTEVISDGKVLVDNLSKLGLDESWLKQQLKQTGIGSVQEVFYAEVQKDGSLFIESKDNLLD